MLTDAEKYNCLAYTKTVNGRGKSEETVCFLKNMTKNTETPIITKPRALVSVLTQASLE